MNHPFWSILDTLIFRKPHFTSKDPRFLAPPGEAPWQLRPWTRRAEHPVEVSGGEMLQNRGLKFDKLCQYHQHITSKYAKWFKISDQKKKWCVKLQTGKTIILQVRSTINRINPNHWPKWMLEKIGSPRLLLLTPASRMR